MANPQRQQHRVPCLFLAKLYDRELARVSALLSTVEAEFAHMGADSGLRSGLTRHTLTVGKQAIETPSRPSREGLFTLRLLVGARGFEPPTS
jgi:hypothetical protein